MNYFWNKVLNCKHEYYPNYSGYVCCGNEDLGCPGGNESHCMKCKVYIIEDDCGSVCGKSGWSIKRWKNKRIWSSKVKWE